MILIFQETVLLKSVHISTNFLEIYLKNTLSLKYLLNSRQALGMQMALMWHSKGWILKKIFFLSCVWQVFVFICGPCFSLSACKNSPKQWSIYSYLISVLLILWFDCSILPADQFLLPISCSFCAHLKN